MRLDFISSPQITRKSVHLAVSWYDCLRQKHVLKPPGQSAHDCVTGAPSTAPGDGEATAVLTGNPLTIHPPKTSPYFPVSPVLSM